MFFRISKFCDSTCAWALAMEEDTRLFSMGWSSGTFSACSTHSTMSDLNSRIRSSPNDR